MRLVNAAATVATLLLAIGATAAPPTQEESALDDAIKLIQGYGAVLEAEAATKVVAVDASRLPAPKEEIKAAILRVLRSDEHKPMHEALKSGYIELSLFQPGVGSEPIHMLPIPDPIPDAADHDALLAVAEAITERADERERWMKIVNDEMHQLVSELKKAGF